MPYAHLLPELETIGRKAAEVALDARRKLEHRLKPDGSIITNADEVVQEYLNPLLLQLAPGSTVWGEESGFEEEGEGGLWAVDPIDGTSNFTFGSPLWGISIALVKGPAIELGMIVLPDLDETYLCARGHGVTRNGQPLPSIPPGKVLPHNLISYNETVVKHVAGSNMPGKMRCAGAFVVDGMFTVGQRYRGMICMKEKLYDMAACTQMAIELDADVRYADGEPLLVEDLKRDEKIAKPWIIFPRDSGFYFRHGF